MIIYPAIDLRDGKVVRLKEGDPNQQTVFSEDPVATAKIWREQGATWLHMVNLDGAFADANQNGDILEQVAQLGLKVQFGGGLRSLDDIANAFDRGAERAVLGTLALKNPEAVEEAIERYSADRICVALDARDGKVTTHGWMEISDQTPVEVGRAMAARGVRHALFTDVTRDGLLTGTNADATVKLAQETGLQVIASGGVATLTELTALAETKSVAGAVIGMALYTQKFTLTQAIAAAQEA